MFIKKATTLKEREYAFYVRTKVFIEEQHVDVEEEIDEHEDACVHFVLYDESHSPIGAGRFRVLDGIGKVERICVLSTSRKKGSGAMIMNAIELHAKETGISKLKLNAQTQAIPFYEKLGYEVVSEEFMDAGIPHKTMIKNI